MQSFMTFKHPARLSASIALLLSSFAPARANADTISYYINQSNSLPDGTNYAMVTISDSTVVTGDIDFTVELIDGAFGVSGDNFGMQNFLFNYDDALSLAASDIVNLSESDWSVRENKNSGGGFGKFDIALSGTGSSRTDLLTFSITGIDGDSIYSYALGSSLNPAADEYFSMHIAGYDETYYTTSAKFAGSTSVVPVPTAAWLFASGLLGLFATARRKV
jgi:hypothetical protein